MTFQETWQATLGELELILSRANFITWFRNTGILSMEGNEVIVFVPTPFIMECLEKKYYQPILKALRNVTSNSEIKTIRFKVESTSSLSNLIQPIQIIKEEKTETTSNKTVSIAVNNDTDLNLKYTFANFIVGKNNELAHAASMAVSKNPGKTYNPLFIYGGVGLGKTHLLQAIGHKILAENPKKKVLYVSCEKFTNEFIAAIQGGKPESFEKKYRLVDVLLVDDIQFISGKERTQEAFFYTFNELHQHNKQVVISSDRPPKAIAALEHRLISRFEWGMIADISTPDLEIKMAIIDAKAKEKNFPLKMEITQYLATVIQNNIRELEGALNRIMAHSQLQNREIGLEEVKNIISSIVSNSQKKPLTPKYVINVVAEYFDIKIEDILSPCRKKILTEPRQIIMYLIREEIKSSYPTIGHELGGRDHTTVIHACEKINRELKDNEKLRQNITILRQKLCLS